ncbi:MAG: hypothetical protein WBJ77_00385 [Bacillota bacterium]
MENAFSLTTMVSRSFRGLFHVRKYDLCRALMAGRSIRDRSHKE